MKRMYGYFGFVFVLTFVLVIVSCSSNSTDPVEQDNNPNNWEMAGVWVGTHFEFISQADTSVKVNLSTYGVSYSMSINADSTYSSSIVFLGQTTQESGKLLLEGNQITLNNVDGDSRSGTYEYTDTGISLVIEDEEFDFNQDGTDEPAFLYADLVKTD